MLVCLHQPLPSQGPLEVLPWVAAAMVSYHETAFSHVPMQVMMHAREMRGRGRTWQRVDSRGG